MNTVSHTSTKAHVLTDCCVCGTEFFIPSAIYENARKRGPDRSFYCPNGHSMSFTKASPNYNFEGARSPEVRIHTLDLDRHVQTLVEAELAKRTKVEVVAPRTYRKSGKAKEQCPHCKSWYKALKQHIKIMHPEASNVD